jgi:hypothetical protein
MVMKSSIILSSLTEFEKIRTELSACVYRLLDKLTLILGFWFIPPFREHAP